MNKTNYDMLYFSVCAINNIIPDKNRISDVDIEKLFKMAKFHSMTAIVNTGLELAGIHDKKFVEEKLKAIRKNLLLDNERQKICEFMENNGIWYMPLKGIILKDLYPQIGMRQMSDNDILYDKNYQKQILQYMKSIGYTVENIGKSHHDEYTKLPIYNYEFHTALFNEKSDKKILDYYIDVKKRLIKDSNKNCAFHFTNEDFYIYIIAHEYKHYSFGGTGLRSLIDRYVYIKSHNLDWEYIENELQKLGISDFEKKSRFLANKIFSNVDLPELSTSETNMLEYYFSSGTYGTVQLKIKNGLAKENNSKLKYLLHRVFPPMNFYQETHPFLYKYKILIPFFYIIRTIRIIFKKHKNILSEIKNLKKT